MQTQIPYCSIKVHEPTQEKVAYHFKVPAANVSRWRKEEKEGKFAAMRADLRSACGGGRRQHCVEMEKELFQQFR